MTLWPNANSPLRESANNFNAALYARHEYLHLTLLRIVRHDYAIASTTLQISFASRLSLSPS